MRLALLGVCALWVTAVPSVHAGELILNTTTATTIVNESGYGKLLLDIRGLDPLEKEWVSGATLQLDFAGSAMNGNVALTIDQLTTDWSPAASWSGPWVRPGGDYSGRATQEVDLVVGAAPSATYDVTDMVRAVVEDGAGDYGFVVLPGNPNAPGLHPAELMGLGALEKATLTVQYRSLSGMGYREGAKALRERRNKTRLGVDRP